MVIGRYLSQLMVFTIASTGVMPTQSIRFLKAEVDDPETNCTPFY